MSIVANLTPTQVPSNTQNGEVPGTLFAHVTVAPAGGAGTYTINHNLQWTPTFVHAICQLTEGTTPTSANALVAFCKADTNATVVAVNFPANGTYDVFYC